MVLGHGWHCMCGASRWHEEITGGVKSFTHIFTAGSRIKITGEEVRSQDRTRKGLHQFLLSSFLPLNLKNLFCRHDCPLSFQIIPESCRSPVIRGLKNLSFSTFCFAFYVAVSIQQKFLFWEYTTEHVAGHSISRSWMVHKYLWSA